MSVHDFRKMKSIFLTLFQHLTDVFNKWFCMIPWPDKNKGGRTSKDLLSINKVTLLALQFNFILKSFLLKSMLVLTANFFREISSKNFSNFSPNEILMRKVKLMTSLMNMLRKILACSHITE